MELPNALDFTQIRERSLKAQRTRVKLDPTNNQSAFNSNSLIQFRLPANVQNTYMDWSNEWALQFKFELKNIYTFASVVTETSLNLDKAGISSIIKKVSFRQAGQVLSEINDYGVLACIMKDLQVSQTHAGNTGALLEGTTLTALGQQLSSTKSAQNVYTNYEGTFSIPLSYNCFANSNKMIPLFGLAPIEIDIELYPAYKVGGWNGKRDNATPSLVIPDSAFELRDVMLTGYYVELSPSAQALIAQSVNNQYQISSNNWRVSNVTIEAGATSVNEIIPINVSSLERVLISHRKIVNETSTTDNTDFTPCSLGNRYYPLLEQYQVFVNGQPFPERPVKMTGKLAEAMTELLMTEHRLSDTNYSSNSFRASDVATNSLLTIDNIYNIPHDEATGISGGIGSFLIGCNFSTLNVGISDAVFGGISTIGSIVNYRGSYTAGGIGSQTQLTFCSEYEVVLHLDMNSTGVFVINQ
jgi:hypothetical protein